MADINAERERWFRDIVLEGEMLRTSQFADSLRETIGASPAVDVTEPVRWFFSHATDEEFDAHVLPNVYPWFSTALFFEADVLGIVIPQAFLTTDGHVDWVEDMQLIRVGYVVEPISPRQLPRHTLPEPPDSVAACMQIAAFTEPREGPLVAPQSIWTVSVGYDGRIVASDKSSGVLTVPVAVPGVGVPYTDGINEFARAGIPLLTACLFAITCGSALSTGYSELRPASGSREGDDQLYQLGCTALLQELASEITSPERTMISALELRHDMFPEGIPAPPN